MKQKAQSVPYDWAFLFLLVDEIMSCQLRANANYQTPVNLFAAVVRNDEPRCTHQPGNKYSSTEIE